MAKNGQLIIVSNRLPMSVSKDAKGKLNYSHSSGGLATAMATLPSKDRIWIGWPGIAADDLSEQDKNDITNKLAKQRCIPVFLTSAQLELFYEGYSNDTLWPLFHYFQSYVQYNEEYWDAYVEVNQLFADAANDAGSANAEFWVHDYQMMLAPAMIRKVHTQASIGFFLHIPFPSFEIFRQLPNRLQLVEGLLGADMVGFHIYDYARHFISSVKHITGDEAHNGKIEHGNREVTVDSFPIGIDYNWFEQQTDELDFKQEVASIREYYDGMQLLASIDRLDYTKGILQKLEAYELYLSENPDMHKKIALTMIAVPSRTNVETYQVLREEIELAISRINGTYGMIDWTPISYQFKNIPMQRVAALLNAADIMLITPLRDGMNLVAKEFVAVQTSSPGVLVLSEMAGAAEELPEAITVNPNSIRGVAEAIGDAIVMPATERKERIELMKIRIRNYDVAKWAKDYLQQLQTYSDRSEAQEYTIDQRGISIITSGYKKANKRLLLLDYDGTLKPLVDSPDPDEAIPSRRLLSKLERLSSQEATEVAIISGRSKSALQGWFGGFKNLTLIAEHGAWIRRRGESWQEQHSSFDEKKEDILRMLQKYKLRTVGSVIEEKTHSVVWHYRNVNSELAYTRNESIISELERILEGTDIRPYFGKKVIDIKPKHINKGVVAANLNKEIQPDMIICIGDDYTDEDMFNALPEQAITIKVGKGASDALLRLQNVQEVHNLLSELVDSSNS